MAQRCYIQFLGAAGTVTGSKHLVHATDPSGRESLQVLIDCGLFQGRKEWRLRNWEPLPMAAREIDALVLTHAHLDHAGWIPRLLQSGYRGPIYATPATVDLCGLLLPDSGHLQEEEAEFHNRKKTSKHSPALPLYTREQAENSLQRLQPREFGTSHRLTSWLSFRYARAGHILGSAMVELTLERAKEPPLVLLFSGDLGRMRDQEVAPGKVVRGGPERASAADVLVMESTYGNRSHPKEDVRPELARLIRETVQRGGSVVVPAFAVERTQKFLFVLKQLMEAGEIPRVPVFADSPMAIKAVKVFLDHEQEFTPETCRLIREFGSPLEWPGFSFAITPEESKRINDSRYPAVIISSSGMVTGGRILHHLMLRLPDPRNQVIFIGFQAPGTRGAIIREGAPTVKIFGQEVPIRARVAALDQFSDHADTPELMEWLGGFERAPRQTWLVHGEPEASAALRDTMRSQLGWSVNVAEYMGKVEVLRAGQAMGGRG